MYPYENKALTPVELGASIFVTETNKNLYRATQLFGIDTFDLGGGDSDMGIWNGENFIVTVCRLLSIEPVILLTPTKAYGPGIPGKVVGHVENHMEVWVPFARYHRGTGQRNGLQIRDRVFNNTRVVECGTSVRNAQLHYTNTH